MKVVEAKAPGKILWIGGYAIVEQNNIGFVTTVDATVNVFVSKSADNSIFIDAKALKIKARGYIDLESGKIDIINLPKELLLIKTAAELSLMYIRSIGKEISGISLKSNNSNAFSINLNKEGKISKTGLGSSAAVTVATVGAILNLFNIKITEKDELQKISQLSHAIATGKLGSGFDIAAAVYGTIVYSRYSPQLIKNFPIKYSNNDIKKLIFNKWDYKINKLKLPVFFRIVAANFVDEGTSTSRSLGSINEFKAKDPKTYNHLIKQINNADVKAVKILKKIKSNDSELLIEFKKEFENARHITKKLGEFSNVNIEEDECSKIIEESMDNGAFVAKLPGAGGRDSIVALCIDKKSENKLKKFWRQKKELVLIKTNISNKGIKIKKYNV